MIWSVLVYQEMRDFVRFLSGTIISICLFFGICPDLAHASPDAVLSGLRARASAGDVQAMHELAQALTKDAIVAWRAGQKEQRSHLQTLAQHWYLKAAQGGNAQAQLQMGLYYDGFMDGRLGTDYSQALHWYKLSSHGGQCIASFNIGRLYENGRGVAASSSTAMHWYERSALAGCAQAPGAVARVLLKIGRAQADATPWVLRAIHWLSINTLPVAFGAAYQIGALYEGLSLPDAQATAAIWYLRAGFNNVQKAQIALARLYMEGSGVMQDDRYAYFWLMQANRQSLRRQDDQIVRRLGMLNKRILVKDREQVARWMRSCDLSRLPQQPDCGYGEIYPRSWQPYLVQELPPEIRQAYEAIQ